jgi:hypothetical protein
MLYENVNFSQKLSCRAVVNVWNMANFLSRCCQRLKRGKFLVAPLSPSETWQIFGQILVALLSPSKTWRIFGQIFVALLSTSTKTWQISCRAVVTVWNVANFLSRCCHRLKRGFFSLQEKEERARRAAKRAKKIEERRRSERNNIPIKYFSFLFGGRGGGCNRRFNLDQMVLIV